MEQEPRAEPDHAAFNFLGLPFGQPPFLAFRPAAALAGLVVLPACAAKASHHAFRVCFTERFCNLSPMPQPSNSPVEELFDPKLPRSAETIRATHTDEIVIALCGPLGAPLHMVAERLKIILGARFGYECQALRLSGFIEDFKGKAASPDERAKRTRELIEKGNALRRDYRNAVLAELAVHDIHMRRLGRQKAGGEKVFKSARFCHVIDSIKNQEELDLLRLVYRDMLYCIGVLSPVSFREENLRRQGVSSRDISDLMDRDSGEEKGYGQTVRDTFPQSDFFLRVEDDVTDNIDKKVERFLGIILNSDVHTPTADETAMYMAAAAATNSACLSRQVGAAVTDEAGQVLAVGWNDVPKYGGNLYQSGGEVDRRCFRLDGGKCFNDEKKINLTHDILKALVDAGVLKRTDETTASHAIETTRVKSLIEFSRSIHAEMHAIITASQKSGTQVVGGRLFCTTYPCHSCARHIIAAGLKAVYYIEPYRKSLATDLHSDALTESETEPQKVKILPFDGVAPNRYMDLFRMRNDSRKKDGKKQIVNLREATPKIDVTLQAMPVLEAAVVASLADRKLIGVAPAKETEAGNEANIKPVKAG